MKDSKVKKVSLLTRIKDRLHRKVNDVPEELLLAINQCSTLEELKELLFTSDNLDTSCLKAFDRKIEELQKRS